MTAPTLHIVSPAHLDPASTEVLVIGVAAASEGPRLVEGGTQIDGAQAAVDAIGFGGGRDEVRRVPGLGGARSLALVGLGSSPVTPDTLRYAAGTAARQLRGVDSITIALPAQSDDAVLAILEGAAIGAYTFTDYRSKVDEKKRTTREVTVVADTARADALVETAAATASAVHTVRDLVSTPPSDLYPQTLADAAVRLGGEVGIQVDVLDEAALVAGGYGGILGVGQGSSRGPRLVKMSYSPSAASSHLALVGKGITFDTGGLSLKPPASMVGMKYDMTGAATALAVIVAAARLGVPVRMTAWLCLAENMPSGTAIRPNDVLTIRGGTTVEVLNTDAEGRLVLADGLVAASEEHPDAIIDIATLTGAAAVAMGTRYVATMGDEGLVAQVVAAAGAVGETFWPMPLPGELRALLDSDVADIANVKIGNTAGGMLVAGVFLEQFVGRIDGTEGARIPWAHLDIAGAANNAGAGWGYTTPGSTGVAVRALLEVCRVFADR
ncbi:MAG: hypothetical protein RI885_1779 [Actinomycetota bacterium]|jgi:leucyl aminopeptidase